MTGASNADSRLERIVALSRRPRNGGVEERDMWGEIQRGYSRFFGDLLEAMGKVGVEDGHDAGFATGASWYKRGNLYRGTNYGGTSFGD